MQLKFSTSSEIQVLPQRVTNVETETSTLKTLINSKQDLLVDGDLSIAKTASLQSLLDTKVEANQIVTKAQADTLLY